MKGKGKERINISWKLREKKVWRGGLTRREEVREDLTFIHV